MTVGIAFGSGGARGWAHIGVIDALEEAGVPIDCVAGTSMGSLVGAALAAGRVRELHKTALDLDWKQVMYYFLEFGFPRSGLIDGERIVATIRQQIAATTIDTLPVPYRAVAADLRTGDEVVIDSGDVIAAVRASISIPGMFTPVAREGRLLVDGGTVNPVPVSVLRDMGADYTIAVNISARFAGKDATPPATEPAPQDEEPVAEDAAEDPWERMVTKIRSKTRMLDPRSLQPVKQWIAKSEAPNIFDVLGDSFRIMETQLAATQLGNSPPDLLIEPELPDVNFMEFHRAQEIIDRGYGAARKALEENDSWQALRSGSIPVKERR
jgi:NTE family protein